MFYNFPGSVKQISDAASLITGYTTPEESDCVTVELKAKCTKL